MSDIEDSDDDRSVNSDESDVDNKMKEFNSKLKTKLPFDNDGSGDETSDADSDDEDNVAGDDDEEDDDGSMMSSDMEELDKEMGEDAGAGAAPPVATKKKKTAATKTKQPRIAENEDDFINEINDELDEDEEEAEIEEKEYLRKFGASTRAHVISEHHQELLQHSSDEIEAMATVSRGIYGEINDPLHRTLPFLTKYERARILGERAKQINAGAKPLIKVPDTLIDGYLIALKELEQKRIPFIIKRPLPNGGCEYWRLVDLEVL
jgi:DNA-directed RNA polymerase subunit K/omega